MNISPIVAGVEITTDKQGRFNLNLLHSAHLALNPDQHRNSKQPSDWLKLEGTKEIIGEISNSEDPLIKAVESKAGRYGGTFAHELLAISYAGWISPSFQLKVNQVFLDYRTGLLQPAVPQSFPEALRLAAEAMEQRDRAIATKAEIGSRREATAMSTASNAVRKAVKLEAELDQSKEYCTVKRMQMIHHGQKFNWRLLKSTAIEMELPAKDVFDANYGTVKAYHADVWAEAYAVSTGEEATA